MEDLRRRILVPPPLIHRHRYHVVLTPDARLRARVIALGRAETTDDDEPEVPTREERAEEALSAPRTLPHRPPPVAPAREPPQGDFLLDQSPAADLTEPEPVRRPPFARCPDFDQSLPDDLDA